ncbi:ATP-binding cassette domain-containing protein [Oerskovia sp. M15]
MITDEASIVFDGVRKEYPNGTVAVGDLSLSVREHEMLALVGPSGCGKSTTLRMTNRLVEPSAAGSCSEERTSRTETPSPCVGGSGT